MKHRQLIRMTQKMGYNIPDNGVCQGFSAMWMQAVCAGDLKNFEIRLKILEKYADNPELLLKHINSVRNIAKRPNPILTAEHKVLLEIPAFFEGIASYHEPDILSEISNKSLGQGNVLEISEYVSSIKQEQTGLAQPFKTVNQYNKKSLTAFLLALNSRLQNSRDTAILLGSANHTVGIRSIGNNEFELVDTNRLDLVGKKLTGQQLSNELYDSFLCTQDALIMRTEVYTPGTSRIKSNQLCNLADTSILTELELHNGITLLHAAAFSNDIKTLDRIHRSNIDVNTPDNNGLLALQFSCIPGNREAFEFLLSTNQLTCKSLKYALCFCAPKHMYDYASQIMDYASRHKFNVFAGHPSPLHEACRSGDINMVKLFVENGADISSSNLLGHNALTSAVIGKSFPMVNYLLQTGLDVNQKCPDGRTPLHFACFNGNKEIAQLLLQNGAEINSRTNDNNLPLTQACKAGYAQLIPILLPKTRLTMEDITPDSPLIKIIPQCDIPTQIAVLDKILECYIADRQQADEHTRIWGAIFNAPGKQEKLDAAQALLDNVRGIKTSLNIHQEALNDHRLGDFYKLYNNLKFNNAKSLLQDMRKTGEDAPQIQINAPNL